VLQKRYREDVVPALMQEFNYGNITRFLLFRKLS